MNIEIISYAVMFTHLPSYVFRQTGFLAREAATPVMGSIIRSLTHSDINFNYFTSLKKQAGRMIPPCLLCQFFILA